MVPFRYFFLIVLAGLASQCYLPTHAQPKPKFLPLQPQKLKIAQAAMQEAIAKKDSNLLAEAYYLYGKLYRPSGDLYTAKKYFLQSLRIVEKKGYSETLARLYYVLGNNALKSENYAETQQYLAAELKTAQSLQTLRALARVYGGLVLFHRKDWSLTDAALPPPNRDSVWYYLEKHKALLPSITDTLDILSIYRQITEELMLRKRYSEALPYYEKSLSLSRQINNPPQECYFLFHLAVFYSLTGKPHKSLPYLSRAERIQATLPGNAQHVSEMAYTSAEAFHAYYQAIGDWQLAHQYQAKLHQLQLLDIYADKAGALSRLSAQYDAEKKDLLLSSQRQQLEVGEATLKKQQMLSLMLLVLFVVAVVSGGILFYWYRQNKQLALRNEILVNEQNHRVKNNLQTIISMLYLQANRLHNHESKALVDTTQQRLKVMAFLQRHLYDRDKLDSISLADYVQDLLKAAIESWGRNDIETLVDIPPNLLLTTDHALSVGFIIHELVVNACKHAFASQTSPFLQIKAVQTDGKCIVEVVDNGTGYESDNISKASFGLRLIELQVKQLKGTYRIWNDNGSHFTMQFKC